MVKSDYLPEVLTKNVDDVKAYFLNSVFTESWRVDLWVQELEHDKDELPCPYSKSVTFRVRLVCSLHNLVLKVTIDELFK